MCNFSLLQGKLSLTVLCALCFIVPVHAQQSPGIPEQVINGSDEASLSGPGPAEVTVRPWYRWTKPNVDDLSELQFYLEPRLPGRRSLGCPTCLGMKAVWERYGTGDKRTSVLLMDAEISREYEDESGRRCQAHMNFPRCIPLIKSGLTHDIKAELDELLVQAGQHRAAQTESAGNEPAFGLQRPHDLEMLGVLAADHDFSGERLGTMGLVPDADIRLMDFPFYLSPSLEKVLNREARNLGLGPEIGRLPNVVEDNTPTVPTEIDVTVARTLNEIALTNHNIESQDKVDLESRTRAREAISAYRKFKTAMAAAITGAPQGSPELEKFIVAAPVEKRGPDRNTAERHVEQTSSQHQVIDYVAQRIRQSDHRVISNRSTYQSAKLLDTSLDQLERPALYVISAGNQARAVPFDREQQRSVAFGEEIPPAERFLATKEELNILIVGAVAPSGMVAGYSNLAEQVDWPGEGLRDPYVDLYAPSGSFVSKERCTRPFQDYVVGMQQKRSPPVEDLVTAGDAPEYLSAGSNSSAGDETASEPEVVVSKQSAGTGKERAVAGRYTIAAISSAKAEAHNSRIFQAKESERAKGRVTSALEEGALRIFRDQGRFPATTLAFDQDCAGHKNEPGYRLTVGGTSSAATIVAGIAAIVQSINPELSAKSIREVLLSTAEVVPVSHPIYRRVAGKNVQMLYPAYRLVAPERAARKAVDTIVLNWRDLWLTAFEDISTANSSKLGSHLDYYNSRLFRVLQRTNAAGADNCYFSDDQARSDFNHLICNRKHDSEDYKERFIGLAEKYDAIEIDVYPAAADPDTVAGRVSEDGASPNVTMVDDAFNGEDITLRFVQKFSGFRKDRRIYCDTSLKTITFKLVEKNLTVPVTQGEASVESYWWYVDSELSEIQEFDHVRC